MTNEEILQIDFYDLCGIGALWMTDDDKIKYWREVIEGKNLLLFLMSNKCLINV